MSGETVRAAASDADRARRLLALLPHLRDGERVPLARLAAAVGTDQLTVEADLTTLSLCGPDPYDPGSLVSVYVEDGEAVVFGRTATLDQPLRLTAAEVRALSTALETVGLDAEGPLLSRLSEAAADSGDAGKLARTVRAAAAPNGLAAVYGALVSAIAARRAVRIRYWSAGRGAEGVRIVHPWQLYHARGAWYLRALCTEAGEERTFRLDRITGMEQLPDAFDRPAGLDEVFDAAPDPDGLPRATVRFAADAPDLNDRDWPGARFERQPDGSVLASIPYAGGGWIARKVAARLGEAELLAPAGLRQAVEKVARGMLSNP